MQDKSQPPTIRLPLQTQFYSTHTFNLLRISSESEDVLCGNLPWISMHGFSPKEQREWTASPAYSSTNVQFGQFSPCFFFFQDIFNWNIKNENVHFRHRSTFFVTKLGSWCSKWHKWTWFEKAQQGFSCHFQDFCQVVHARVEPTFIGKHTSGIIPAVRQVINLADHHKQSCVKSGPKSILNFT